MITLEKLLTELKAESLNEIVAGTKCGKGPKGKSRKSKKSKSSKSTKSAKSRSSKSYGCYTPPAPCGCTPPSGGCQ